METSSDGIASVRIDYRKLHDVRGRVTIIDICLMATNKILDRSMEPFLCEDHRKFDGKSKDNEAGVSSGKIL